MDNQELFIVQSNLMNESLELVSTRIDRLEKKALTPGLDAKTEQTNIALCQFMIRSLTSCRNVIEFISKEIMVIDNPMRYHFLLTNTRTLLDTFARLIHLQLNLANEIDRALTCVTYQLLSYKSLEQDKMYNYLLDTNKDIIGSRPEIIFPKSYSEFTKKWISKSGLAFANRDDLLTEENIAKYCPYGIKVFSAKKPYKIYSFLSEMIHGNPYYINDITKERFWIIGLVIPYSMFIIEMIDNYSLGWVDAKDLKIWRRKVESTKKDFVKLWKTNRV